MLKRVLPVIALCIFLHGCGPVLKPLDDGRQIFPASESLWNLGLERRGKTLFSGLLVLRSNDRELHYAVLDATGIKLLEASLDNQGNSSVLYALDVVKNKGLPGYLDKSLKRIFMENPGEQPCERRFLKTLCLGEIEGSGALKKAWFGLFTLWEVEYFFEKSHSSPMERVLLRNGWLQPDVALKAVKE